MPPKTNGSDHSEDVLQLRIERDQGEIQPTFTNNFVVQRDGDDFHIRFYQIVPPIVLGEDSVERTREVEKLQGAIEAPCVAHLVLSKGRMQEFVEILLRQSDQDLSPTRVQQTESKNQ